MKFTAKIENGKINIDNKSQFSNFCKNLEGKQIDLIIEKRKFTRTLRQNDALHLMFQQITAEMINNGQTMRDVIRKDFDIQPTPELLKEVWRTIQIVQLGKNRTRDLTKDELDKVYEPFMKFIGEVLQIYVPFPSLENNY